MPPASLARLGSGGKGAEYFAGADNRMIYAPDYTYVKGKNAVLLDNTSKGYGYTFNLTANMQPVDMLNLMLAYTHTESKEVSGMPGNDPVSTWQGLITVDGPNFGTVQRSRYVIPDRLIGSATWTIPFEYKGLARNTNISIFYTGYSATGNSFCYTNDMNGDGIAMACVAIFCTPQLLLSRLPKFMMSKLSWMACLVLPTLNSNSSMRRRSNW